MREPQMIRPLDNPIPIIRNQKQPFAKIQLSPALYKRILENQGNQYYPRDTWWDPLKASLWGMPFEIVPSFAGESYRVIEDLWA